MADTDETKLNDEEVEQNNGEQAAEGAEHEESHELAREEEEADRKSTRLNSSHSQQSRMPSSA